MGKSEVSIPINCILTMVRVMDEDKCNEMLVLVNDDSAFSPDWQPFLFEDQGNAQVIL